MRRILIVDDHVLTRMGMAQFVRHTLGDVLVAEAQDVKGAVAMIEQHPWEMFLLDIDLPDGSGLDILEQIRARYPGAPVLFVSGMIDEEFAIRAMRGGASGFVEKGSAPDELRTAIHTVLEGGRYISSKMAGRLALMSLDPAAQSPSEVLSDREFQVLRHITLGKTVSEIAQELGLSVKTVSTYRARLLEKLKLGSTTELVRYGLRKGLDK
jgi:DNA-binding NarL/FixJ family response regulator